MRRLRRYLSKAAAAGLCIIMAFNIGGCGGLGSGKTIDDIMNDVAGMGNGLGSVEVSEGSSESGTQGYGDELEEPVTGVTALARNLLLGTFAEASRTTVQASVSEPGISSIDEAVNSGAFRFQDAEAAQFLKNGFIVYNYGGKEFFSVYEMNRYDNIANFVTVDSMMHAYHMYFAYLLKNTERNYLSSLLLQLSETMLAASREQYSALAGTEWENAAKRNVEYFTVAAALLNENESIDDYAADVVNAELNMIYSANDVQTSALTGTFIDYSQFKPRGYYEGDGGLEKYFRAMMWYGQIGFVHKDEDLDRSAFLINLALDEGGIDLWEEIYSVTSFFAGASDDLTYYEIMPAIWEAYGEDVKTDEIAGNSSAWEEFRGYIDAMPSPSINSIPTMDDENRDTHANNENKGFRFMGQRFTIDEAVFQQLVYDYVGENANGDKRMLPDTLDFAAALGNDTAYAILDAQGDTGYEDYPENMEVVRTGIENANDDLWSASLYGAWIYTLAPLLEEKGEGYPEFMKNEEWAKKDLETFAGSYTELKHDTVLYAKQVMAEMGGGPIPDWDTRGYVEPEVETWARFETLANMTADGLASYGLIADEDVQNLNTLADLASSFRTISEKELTGELLTTEEYELIEYYGGDLEHLWRAALADEGENINVTNFPAALVTDIATDPNGLCLEIGTGNPTKIYILVYFDGGYHICSGAMYSFYQFEWPLNDRLTDSAWRQMMGLEVTASGSYNYDSEIDKPEWTMSYRYER